MLRIRAGLLTSWNSSPETVGTVASGNKNVWVRVLGTEAFERCGSDSRIVCLRWFQNLHDAVSDLAYRQAFEAGSPLPL